MAREHYRVGGAARAAGVGVQTLHYYERRGLIGAAARTASGYREYGSATVRRVRAIKRAQTLGFSLTEIQELIGIAGEGRSAAEVGELARRKVEEIDTKLADLGRVRARLVDALETCRCGGDIGRCDVLAGLAPSLTQETP